MVAAAGPTGGWTVAIVGGWEPVEGMPRNCFDADGKRVVAAVGKVLTRPWVTAPVGVGGGGGTASSAVVFASSSSPFTSGEAFALEFALLAVFPPTRYRYVPPRRCGGPLIEVDAAGGGGEPRGAIPATPVGRTVADRGDGDTGPNSPDRPVPLLVTFKGGVLCCWGRLGFWFSNAAMRLRRPPVPLVVGDGP